MRRLVGSVVSICLLLVFGGCGGGGGGGSAGASESATAKPYRSYAAPSENTAYDVTILGDLGDESWAIAVNDAGQVTGNYQEADGSVNAFYSDAETMLPLIASAQAADVNEAGQVVGWLEGENPEAFLYDGDLIRLVPASFSRAYAVNDAGQVVGHRKGGEDEPFLEENGRLQRLAEVNGYAAQINNHGDVVIQELREEGVGALLLKEGRLTDYGSLGGRDLYVQDIDESGRAVGWGTTANGEYHAFLWQDGRLIDLAPAVGHAFCAAVAISEDGAVLIKAMTVGGYRAYLWRNGEISELATFGAPAAMVTDMNNRGQIVGWLEAADGKIRAFLATPKAGENL